MSIFDINIGQQPHDGKRDIGISIYSNDTDKTDVIAEFVVPVKASDSVSEMESEAREKMTSYLELLLSDLRDSE